MNLIDKNVMWQKRHSYTMIFFYRVSITFFLLRVPRDSLAVAPKKFPHFRTTPLFKGKRQCPNSDVAQSPPKKKTLTSLLNFLISTKGLSVFKFLIPRKSVLASIRDETGYSETTRGRLTRQASKKRNKERGQRNFSLARSSIKLS